MSKIKIDHSKKSFVEAVGFSTNDYEELENNIKSSLVSNESISKSIEIIIEEIREEYFGKTDANTTAYEMKLILAGLSIGRLIERKKAIDSITEVDGITSAFLSFLKKKSEKDSED
jgi:hypothetical protein